jgi:hypothetical protein
MKWDDWNAERPFIEVSTANRRNQILGECRQFKNDVDSYNDRRVAAATPENSAPSALPQQSDAQRLPFWDPYSTP